jgi:hypothetical protein
MRGLAYSETTAAMSVQEICQDTIARDYPTLSLGMDEDKWHNLSRYLLISNPLHSFHFFSLGRRKLEIDDPLFSSSKGKDNDGWIRKPS